MGWGWCGGGAGMVWGWCGDGEGWCGCGVGEGLVLTQEGVGRALPSSNMYDNLLLRPGKHGHYAQSYKIINFCMHDCSVLAVSLLR